MSEEPEEVLPKQRTAAAADVQWLTRDDHAGRQEEAGTGQVVDELHRRRRFQRREGEDQQKRGDKLRPDEERQTHPVHAFRAELDDRGHEVDRSEQRRGDVEHHSDEPHGLAIDGVRQVVDAGERGIGGPTGFCRTRRHDEAGEHQQAAQQVALVADHVQTGEGHVRCADLQGDDIVAEGADPDGHDGQENHDGSVHRAERVVEIRKHDAGNSRRVLADPQIAQDCLEQPTDDRQRFAGIGHLPAHRQHQEQTDQHEAKGRQPVLQADDLVVRREHVFSPEAQLVVIMSTVLGVRSVRRSLLCHRVSFGNL